MTSEAGTASPSEHLSSSPVFSVVRVSFMCMFCRSFFVLFYFFFWPLCCLFFFDMRILVTSLWYLQTLLVLLSFFFWPLCCLFFFDIRILITPLPGIFKLFLHYLGTVNFNKHIVYLINIYIKLTTFCNSQTYLHKDV